MENLFFKKKDQNLSQQDKPEKGVNRREFIKGVAAMAGIVALKGDVPSLLGENEKPREDYLSFAKRGNEQMKADGTIPEYKELYTPALSENIYNRVTPHGYGLGKNVYSGEVDHLKEIVNALGDTYEKKEQHGNDYREEEIALRENVWKLILGLPQSKEEISFLLSPHQPSVREKEVSPYLCFKNPFFEQLILEKGLSMLDSGAFQERGKQKGNAQALVIPDSYLLDVLGSFTLYYAENNKEDKPYFSYYDIWDINPLGIDEKKMIDKGFLEGAKKIMKFLLKRADSIDEAKKTLGSALGDKASSALRFVSEEYFQEMKNFFKQRDDKEIDEILDFLLTPRKVEIYNKIYFDPKTGKRILDKSYKDLFGDFEANMEMKQVDEISASETKVVFVNNKLYFFDKRMGLPVSGTFDFNIAGLEKVKVEKGELSKEDTKRYQGTEQWKKMIKFEMR